MSHTNGSHNTNGTAPAGDEHVLANLLRPHMPRIISAVRGGPAADTDAEAVGQFTPADLPRFFDYYAADAAGRYPGGIHRVFGVSPKQFADATGLRQTTATTGGVVRTYWV